MEVLMPKPINLISSNVSETDYEAYVAVFTYAKDAFAVYNHRIYKSLQDANTGNTPSTSVLWWSDQGATNRWKMFDEYTSTQTVVGSGGTLNVALGFNRCTGFALLNMNADWVTATQKDSGGNTVWTETISLLADQLLADWYMYFYEEITPSIDVVRTNLPVYGTASIEFVFYKGVGSVAVGHCVVGATRELAKTTWGVQAGLISYGRKDTDAFGYTYLKPGNYAKKVTLTAHVTNAQVDFVHKFLADLRERPCVWMCDNSDTGLQALTLYGFWKDFQIEIPGPAMSSLSLEIEGLA